MVKGAASQSFIEKSQLLESGMVGTFHKPSEAGDKCPNRRPSLC